VCVLVHCSDGWDRTSLLTSLSQLCLDAYSRTIEGFIVLVEKEWMSFGHRFLDRLGHGHFSQECSPIFLQFLDAVWQLVRQFPTHFQFDQRLLLWLHHTAYSGEFGTFYFNSEEERVRARASERTRSCWTHVQMHLDEFFNTTYGRGWAHLPQSAAATRPAEPLPAFASLPLFADPSVLYVDVKELRFWSDLYLAYKQTAQGLLWNGNLVPSTFSPAAPAAAPRRDPRFGDWHP